MRIILLSLLLSSCVTPDEWSSSEHQRMLLKCRIACGDNDMASYDSWLAKCSCYKPEE